MYVVGPDNSRHVVSCVPSIIAENGNAASGDVRPRPWNLCESWTTHTIIKHTHDPFGLCRKKKDDGPNVSCHLQIIRNHSRTATRTCVLKFSHFCSRTSIKYTSRKNVESDNTASIHDSVHKYLCHQLLSFKLNFFSQIWIQVMIFIYDRTILTALL